MKWQDCAIMFMRCSEEFMMNYGKAIVIKGQRKIDMWKEVYRVRAETSKYDNIYRSLSMLLDMITLHLIQTDNLKEFLEMLKYKASYRRISLDNYIRINCNLELNIAEDFLIKAVYYHSDLIINWLLKKGTDPFIYNNHGVSPIIQAFCNNDNLDIVKLFIKHSNDPNILDKYNGCNITYWALSRLITKDQRFMKLLRVHGGTVYEIYKQRLLDSMI